jgi:hypothetical protein
LECTTTLNVTQHHTDGSKKWTNFQCLCQAGYPNILSLVIPKKGIEEVTDAAAVDDRDPGV